ncbi:MAG: glutamate 5-kinase [Candidatus Omnitrophica bacterium]|nr:glutamate 5-kinase [Candidatus Omnitrophota bacterium]
MKKIVVKVGSSVIAPQGRLDTALVGRLLVDIHEAERQGFRMILVSSGAIACGMHALGYREKPRDTASLMAISSCGQIALMDVFNAKCKRLKRSCAQLLLTWEDFDHRARFKNVRKTIEKLLSFGVLPVINENDVVSFEEIRFGDNDRLSALVADLITAQKLIILSDVHGLYDGETLVKEVVKMESKIPAMVRRSRSGHTSGGMQTKLQAAAIAMSSGIPTHIAYGREKNVISRIVGGEHIGTLFAPLEKIGKARKRWIAFGKKPKGKLYVDEGAAEAVLHKGKSLLAVGIRRVEGRFARGDAVHVLDEQGTLLGYGIVNYDAAVLRENGDQRLEKAVIHRDDFVRAWEEGWYCNPCIVRK